MTDASPSQDLNAKAVRFVPVVAGSKTKAAYAHSVAESCVIRPRRLLVAPSYYSVRTRPRRADSMHSLWGVRRSAVGPAIEWLSVCWNGSQNQRCRTHANCCQYPREASHSFQAPRSQVGSCKSSGRPWICPIDTVSRLRHVQHHKSGRLGVGLPSWLAQSSRHRYLIGRSTFRSHTPVKLDKGHHRSQTGYLPGYNPGPFQQSAEEFEQSTIRALQFNGSARAGSQTARAAPRP